MILSHGFFPKITLPTRICESTSTLIDNIFTNNIDVPDSSGITGARRGERSLPPGKLKKKFYQI